MYPKKSNKNLLIPNFMSTRIRIYVYRFIFSSHTYITLNILRTLGAFQRQKKNKFLLLYLSEGESFSLLSLLPFQHRIISREWQTWGPLRSLYIPGLIRVSRSYNSLVQSVRFTATVRCKCVTRCHAESTVTMEKS